MFFQIIIRADCGSFLQTDIAIDDVSFSPECLQFQGGLFFYKGKIPIPLITNLSLQKLLLKNKILFSNVSQDANRKENQAFFNS